MGSPNSQRRRYVSIKRPEAADNKKKSKFGSTYHKLPKNLNVNSLDSEDDHDLKQVKILSSYIKGPEDFKSIKSPPSKLENVCGSPPASNKLSRSLRVQKISETVAPSNSLKKPKQSERSGKSLTQKHLLAG